MRAAAIAESAHPAVEYRAGSAERIPVPDASCDVVVLYLVWHHVQDRAAAAAEVARVLRPGGRVLLRTAFTDRMPELPWHRYFARASAIEAEVFPSLGETTAVFATAGLRPVALERIRQRIASGLGAYAERLRLRAYSTFEHMSEEEITEGFAALDTAVAGERDPQPVDEDCDLLVLRDETT